MLDKLHEFRYIYRGIPIDFFIGSYSIVDAVIEIALSEPQQDEKYIKEEARSLVRKCKEAEFFVKEKEGKLRTEAEICFMPDLSGYSDGCSLHPIIIVKADNNGTTYVFSDFPICDPAKLENWEIVKSPTDDKDIDWTATLDDE